MSICTETGYLVKDVKEEIKDKIKSKINYNYKSIFLTLYLATLLVYIIFTYMIIFTKNSYIIVVLATTLFLFSSYQIYLYVRALILCDKILKKDRKILLLTEKVIKEIDDLKNKKK